MPNTYKLIASSTVGSGGAATITFSSIPNTYTDLKIFLSGRTGSTAEGYPFMRFNGDTGTNYTFQQLRGDGGTAGGSTTSNLTFANLYVIPGTNYTANTFGSIDVSVPNYASSTVKPFSVTGVVDQNAGAGYNFIQAHRWVGTSAINSVTLYLDASNTFAQYTTAYLYGIKNS